MKIKRFKLNNYLAFFLIFKVANTSFQKKVEKYLVSFI